MAKTSALSSGSEAIHTRTDGAGTSESQVAVIGIDGSDSVVGADTTNGLDVDVTRMAADSITAGQVTMATAGSVVSLTDPRGAGNALINLFANEGCTITIELDVTASGSTRFVGAPELYVLFLSGTAPTQAGLSFVAGGWVRHGGTTITMAVNSRVQLVVPMFNARAVQVTAQTVVGPTGPNASIRWGTSNSAVVASVQGDTFDNAVDSGVAAVKVGAIYESSLPTYTSGRRTSLHTDVNGRLIAAPLEAGTNNIGDVDVLTLPGSLTGKAEDTASAPADVGIPILGVRNDTPTALTDTDGDYTMMATDKYGRTQIAPVRSLAKTVGVSGSLGITTAATWDERAVWAVPASTLFAPKQVRCAVTTASTRTLILAGKRLGTFNPGTNAFVADGSVTGNDFYDRLMYRIVVTHSATATNVTATYTDQGAASGNSTSALTIPSAAVAGDWYEFIFAAGDFGVQAVTAVSDSANPTSVVDEIWGFRTLLEDLGPAITPHTEYLGEGLQVPNGESIVILFNAAATTAQQRFASVVGDLVAA